MVDITQSSLIPPEPSAVSAALSAAGIIVDAASMRLVLRDDRFLVELPDNRMAWFALNASGHARLEREARVLGLIEQHCGFRAPRLLLQSPLGWQLRQLVPGTSDPWATYRRASSDRGFAFAVGQAMGHILADQHTNIARHDIAGWLPPQPSWPPPRHILEPGLRHASDDALLVTQALTLLERAEAFEAAVTDRVFTHCDFGFHNLVVEPSGSITGVFDYDDAACADRHHDFKLLLLDIADESVLAGALDTYRIAPIDYAQVCLLNAVSAVAFLATREDAAPEDRPAGRTLAEDLRWTRIALDRAG